MLRRIWKCLRVWIICWITLCEHYTSGQIIGIGDVIDESVCYSDLFHSDKDKNGFLDREEYLHFLNLQSDDYFLYTNGEFSALPSSLQNTFDELAVCMNGCLGDCCGEEERGIDIGGTEPRGGTTDLETLYLFAVCSRTFADIEAFMTPAPTAGPTVAPTVTPTLSPSSTPVPVPTVDKPADDQPIVTTGLSPGAVAGIAVMALAIGFIAVAAIYSHQKRKSAKNEQFIGTQSGDASDKKPPSPELRDKQPGSTLGASTPHYGPHASSKIAPAVSFTPLEEPEDEDIESQAESSQAGSSGWSSSAGLSSLNTASVDSQDNLQTMPHTTNLAAISNTSAALNLNQSRFSQQRQPQPHYLPDTSSTASNLESLNLDSSTNSPSLDLDSFEHDHELTDTTSQTSDQLISTSPSVTRADLDHAIEAGDWAAVGATAALLATSNRSASDSSYYSSSKASQSYSQSKTESSNLSSIDQQRAAELDRLVDTGDWEGVVLAAAKFEQANENRSTSSSKQLQDTITNEPPSTSDKSSNLSPTPSTNSNISPSPSTNRKRDEIRQEVEALVKRVVPDEIDNVDEMMLQFRGREEELVETLRTMQERSIAQRARAAVHRTAKREARRSRMQKHSDGSESSSGFPPRPPTPTPPTSSIPTEENIIPPLNKTQTRTALELAIEAGDWEAVGEAAAMMSDASVTTASTDALKHMIETGYASDDIKSNSGTDPSLKSVDVERAAELDRLIYQGDWSGVVAAASRFHSVDALRKSGEGSVNTESSAEYSYHSANRSLNSKEKALQEEQDALAQAEIWMAIAAQSKQEAGSAAKGASDAADWAISRSYNAMTEQPHKSITASAPSVSTQENIKQRGGSDDDKSV